MQLSEKPEDVTAYLSLAATVVANVSVGPDLNDEETRLLRRLLSESELVRQGAQDDLAEEPQTGDAAVAQQLAAALLGGRRDQALDSLQSISLRRVDLIEPVSSVLNRADLLSSITRTELPYFANYPATLEALLELRAAEPMFADAIRDEMRGEVV
ncbi:hypothetical protein FJ656_08340 [Schumannella luteola]|nr:hypothetical protein FJ656_08340 [Schumannella luteola]